MNSILKQNILDFIISSTYSDHFTMDYSSFSYSDMVTLFRYDLDGGFEDYHYDNGHVFYHIMDNYEIKAYQMKFHAWRCDDILIITKIKT